MQEREGEEGVAVLLSEINVSVQRALVTTSDLVTVHGKEQHTKKDGVKVVGEGESTL